MEIIRNSSEDYVINEDAKNAIITAIKPALRDQRRINIFVDDEFRFSLDLAQLADYKLKVGQSLTTEKIDELISASNFGKLYQQTLEYVFARPRSIKETRDHLKRKQYTRKLQKNRYDEFREKQKSDPEFRKASNISSRHPTKPAAPISNSDIEKVITRLIERGYLDDKNFTSYYVENRNVAKGISIKRLKLELKKKGISEPIIAQALAGNPRSQEEEIKKIIAKKRRRNYSDEKLIAYLLRQGFEYELVRNSVLSETD